MMRKAHNILVAFLLVVPCLVYFTIIVDRTKQDLRNAQSISVSSEQTLAKQASAISFELADPSYARDMAVLHRGGWRSVIEGLTDLKVLVEGDAAESSLLLLDVTEKWFVWNFKPPITRPWIGLTHLVLNAPSPFQGMGLQSLLYNPNFQESLPYCVGLVVLSEDGVDPIKRKLEHLIPQAALPRPSSLVCSLLHPIAVESTAVRYNPDIDIPLTVKEGGIVLVGQQYRRAATIHRFPSSSRPRKWMTGNDNFHHIKSVVMSPSLAHEGVEEDPSVELMYTQSYEEYDDLLKHNLVVIDLMCATANNAVLEVLALHVPAFVVRLPSTEQYLGADYPLLFDSFDDLEAFIRDDERLPSLLLAGHDHLKARNKDDLSIAALGEGLRACAMSNVQRHCDLNSTLAAESQICSMY